MLPMLRFTRPALANDFFRNSLLTDLFDNDDSSSVPAVNVVEGKDDYRIEVAAPGLEKKDFKINLDNNVLTISSEKESSKEETDDKYVRKEFSYQSFKRSFSLPDLVTTDKIQAVYNSGILAVTVPKHEAAKVKPAREIEIA